MSLQLSPTTGLSAENATPSNINARVGCTCSCLELSLGEDADCARAGTVVLSLHERISAGAHKYSSIGGRRVEPGEPELLLREPAGPASGHAHENLAGWHAF